MTNQEYEQKKRECWIEFCKEHPIETPNMAIGEAFSAAFDRAFTLGKQTETITQEQIEKAAQEHADELRVSSAIPGALVPMLYDIAKSSYMQGVQDFIGKKDNAPEKPKRMCLRDRTKVCNMCHDCDIDADEWYNVSR